jgi:hypothetical protein
LTISQHLSSARERQHILTFIYVQLLSAVNTVRTKKAKEKMKKEKSNYLSDAAEN